MALHELLRSTRDERQLSRHALAHKSGVSTATIARIELYAVEPRPSTVRALAEALDVEPSIFFAEQA